MFKVKDISTGNIYTVYDIKRIPQERSCSILFLIHTEYKNWVYIDADDFEPIN